MRLFFLSGPAAAGWYNRPVESGRITDVSREALDLDATLASGQVFRWTRDGDGVWHGVLEGGHRARLAQGADGTLYYELDTAASGADAEESVRRFLRLDDLDLPAHAEAWSAADPHFAECWSDHPGIRLLRQDPEECFFSFLCASVAPIARISGMLRAVATEYGDGIHFPAAADLAGATESRLRELGLGFRARRVAAAAQALAAREPGHLRFLRSLPPAEAKAALMAFEGVGEKIADCIRLFSLDHDDAVPVDTHIWRMARARYAPELAGRSLTPAAYARVGEAFRDRFGERAGWAQQILFYRVAVAPGVARRQRSGAVG
jgi:3-methyladenine DNA glycosylase/8-oxoguanine DNA glycosylase